MNVTKSALAISLALAATIVSAAPSYKPGTYEGTAMGINAPVKVAVTVSKYRITAIKVIDQKETKGIGSYALEMIPERILKNQSLMVDNVSGATVSTFAVKTAVADAIKKAGVNPDSLMIPVKTKKTGKAQNLTTDFVVIGAGGSGQIAAIRAGQLGVKTIVLEKMPMVGGAFAMHGGWMIVQGSKLQKEMGVTEDSPNAMVHDFLANGHYKNDLMKLNMYATHVGSTIDWLQDYVGVKFDKKRGLQRLGEYVYNRVMFYEGGTPSIEAAYTAALKRDKNIRLMTNTKAESLIVKNGKVVGVKAVKDGAPVTIKAKAVLIATGGYGNNKAMLQEPVKSALYYGPKSATGDGHRIAAAAGAELIHMERGKIYPNGVEVAPGEAKSTLFGNNAALLHSAIIVNSKGMRVVDEKASNNTIKQKLMSDPKREFYLVMDEPSFKAFRSSLSTNGITEGNVDEWLANDGKSEPLVVKGATLKEVASKARIDGAALEKTVARYNGFVKAKRDEDFGRPAAYMKETVADHGPYYICEQKPRFATTLGSIRATDGLEVLNKNGKVIRNLFVSGEASNVVQGDDSPVGANVGWAATSGKFVAEEVAKRLKK